MKADAKTEAAVMEVMNRYIETYAKRDLSGALALFAPDDDTVIIGTGGDEKRIGMAEIKAQLERDFGQSESATMEFTWHSVSVSGSIAWLAADCIAHIKTGGKKMKLPLRSTIVLEKRSSQWLIVQFHASVPAFGQTEGESFPE